MHRNTVAAGAVVLACLSLGACGPSMGFNGGMGAVHGRYSGVGIYPPAKQWTRLIATQRIGDPRAARPIDDQVIIVVQDSATGEVRACGDLTGYCIGMNPWKKALVSDQVAPVGLTEHVAPDAPADSAAPSANVEK